jgi:hypothetical protein
MQEHEESPSHFWNWDGEETSDEWLVFLPKNCHQTLLNLQVGGDRILPKTPALLETLHKRVKGYKNSSGMKSRVSEALKLDQGVPCKRELARAILSVVDDRMLNFCPSKAAAVHRLYKARLTTKGDFPLAEKLADVNKPVLDLVRLGPSELVNPAADRVSTIGGDPQIESNKALKLIKSQRRPGGPKDAVEISTNRRGIRPMQVLTGLAVLASLGATAILSTISHKSQSTAPALADTSPTTTELTKDLTGLTKNAPHVISLLRETSVFNQSINQEVRAQLTIKLDTLKIQGVTMLDPAQFTIDDRPILPSGILNWTGAKTVQWLTVNDFGATKRLHFHFLTAGVEKFSADGFDNYQDFLQTDPQSLQRVDFVVSSMLGWIVGYRINELKDDHKYYDAGELIKNAYRLDHLMESRHSFAVLQAEIDAAEKHFNDKLLGRSSTGEYPAINRMANESSKSKDLLQARKLFRQSRYEEAYVLLTKDHMDGPENRLNASLGIVTVAPDTVIFELQSPKGYAALVKTGAHSLVVLEWPNVKELDDAFNVDGKQNGLQPLFVACNSMKHNNLTEGLYYAGLREQERSAVREPSGIKINWGFNQPQSIEYIRPIRSVSGF